MGEKLVAVVAPEAAYHLLNAMQAHPLGREAAVMAKSSPTISVSFK
jgi:hypothetical protein